jgi:ferredoxin-NADP reductase
MKVTFDHTNQEAEDIQTFFFKPETTFSYTAGQFTELAVPHINPDSRGTKRWFTLSGPPTGDLLSITTTYYGKQSSTFKKSLFKLKPGTELTMAEPMGDFVLPKLIQTNLIFVAGGIGITPFHSILSWLTASNETRPIKLIYGVKSEEEIIFQDTFDKASQHVTVLVGQPSPAWGGVRGQLNAENILGLEHPSEDTLIYVSGPEQMVGKLQNDLLKAGIKKSQLVLDFFPNYPSI